ncbi:MAG: apolipoprotein acyltransferase [Roseivivax sp.]|nr:apolipoprotein acyltransferase [Roseivivax sp.]
MFVIAGAILGAILGALSARRRKGNGLDMAQYAAGYGILFAVIGMILTVVIEKSL